MIRVLQCVNIMDRAGLETMLMNYYRCIDRTQIQFDFLTHRKEIGQYETEIESLGGRVYHAPRLYPQNYPDYFKWMKQFFTEHPEYKIVHSHIDSMSYMPLLAAKKAGIPVRIAHSHNTNIPLDYKYLLKQYFRANINNVCNYRLACGVEAGKFLFGKESFTVIPNAIKPEKFLYDECVRNSKRKELNLGNDLVVGHVGRFSIQKNHKLLISVFRELLRLHSNSKLLLVGNGELENKIKAEVNKAGIQDKVIFLENRSDVNEIYQAMDVFVMPSLFEGIPVVGIEAQFASLPCIFSNKVPNEVCFTDLCSFVDLKQSPKEWADVIMEKYKCNRKPVIDFENCKYNIWYSYKLLEELYKELNEKY